jgi:O-antigen/teichoic acid export membrane protein
LVVAVGAFPIAGLLLVIVASRSPGRHMPQPLRLSTRDLPAVVRAAWPFAVAELVFQFYARADVILVLWIVGEAAAGIYASAFKFVEVGLVPLFFLGLAAYPDLSRLAERDDALSSAFGQLLRNSLFVAGIVAWGLVFVVPNVVGLILGDRFVGVGPLVRIMAALPPLMAPQPSWKQEARTETPAAQPAGPARWHRAMNWSKTSSVDATSLAVLVSALVV